MDKHNVPSEEELNTLHSAVMAIEELLVKKGVVSLEELNSTIKKASRECKSSRKLGRKLCSH
ncbi:hypothetical protein HZB02_01250 [Candidatus Woesearchaeota archaeon]|nr:hypothetical protein [Candidatus Woesearchaeota archaeon]